MHRSLPASMPLVLLVALVLTIATLQVPPLPRRYRMAEPHGTLGFTEWLASDRRPFAWIRIDLLLEQPQRVVEAVIKHENKHVEQMLRKATSFAGWEQAIGRGGAELYFQMEAEAYCETAKVDAKYGRFPSLEVAIDSAARNLLNPIYPYRKTFPEAVAGIRSYCLDH